MGGIFSSILCGGRYDAVTEGSSESLHVLSFHSSESWQLHFNEVKETSKLVVIDFTASWCGPCKFIAPVFNEMAAKFNQAEFVKIDVDELPDVKKDFKVKAMPTFVLCKKGKEVDRVVGASKDELQKKIQKHYQ